VLKYNFVQQVTALKTRRDLHCVESVVSLQSVKHMMLGRTLILSPALPRRTFSGKCNHVEAVKGA